MFSVKHFKKKLINHKFFRLKITKILKRKKHLKKLKFNYSHDLEYFILPTKLNSTLQLYWRKYIN